MFHVKIMKTENRKKKIGIRKQENGKLENKTEN
jgi:hypothetical protein